MSPSRVRSRLPRRTPYDVLPRRPAHLPRRVVKAAYDLGGPDALRHVIRPLLLAEHVSGRASTPEEAALLREWLDVETDDLVALWTARLSRPGVVKAERPAVVERAPEEALCSVCGAPFERPVGARGRSRTRCYGCSPTRRPTT